MCLFKLAPLIALFWLLLGGIAGCSNQDLAPVIDAMQKGNYHGTWEVTSHGLARAEIGTTCRAGADGTTFHADGQIDFRQPQPPPAPQPEAGADPEAVFAY